MLIISMVVMTACNTIQDVVDNATIIVAVLIGIIEVVARVVPSVGMWAPLGMIIKVLNFISELLNKKK